MTRIKSQQGGKEEPGSHPAAANTDVFVNGKLVVPGAPAESQTEPAKFSEKNARLDVVPIMAKPLGLSDAEKRRIVASVDAIATRRSRRSVPSRPTSCPPPRRSRSSPRT